MRDDWMARLKDARKKKGYTLEKLGKICGTTKSYIWELENKSIRQPSAFKLSEIAKALDVTVDYIITGETEENNLHKELMAEAKRNLIALYNIEDKARVIADNLLEAYKIEDNES